MSENHVEATSRSSRLILPGSVIGILGSGQLGRMLALAAREMGYRVAVFSPEADAPASEVSDVEFVADYTNAAEMERFARSVNVVTFEFENVSIEAANVASRFVPVRPAGSVLHVAQHRLREKTFLEASGFPVTRFAEIASAGDLAAAGQKTGFPAILKTADFGYDGKGQVKVTSASELAAAFEKMAGERSVLEARVDFEKEISVIGARNAQGDFAAFPVFENRHENHILDVTFAPAAISDLLADQAVGLTKSIMEKLEVVGLLTVEMFLTGEGKLLVNELAPRPHNSGHLTIDACVTSQFEQQLRAICGLPLGKTCMHRPAAMVNLLGDVWTRGEPNWAAALKTGAKLHLYGKKVARAGRKMGHITALGETAHEAVERALAAKRAL